MPLPFTVTCFSKIQIGFTFLVPAHLGSPGQRAVKRMCLLHGRTPMYRISVRLCGVDSLSLPHGRTTRHNRELECCAVVSTCRKTSLIHPLTLWPQSQRTPMKPISQYRLCGVVSLSRFLSEHGQSHAHTDSLKQLKANLTRHVANFFFNYCMLQLWSRE